MRSVQFRTSTDPWMIPAPEPPNLEGSKQIKEKIKHFIKVLSYHVAMTMAHKMYNEDKCGQWDNCPQATYVCPLNWSSSTHLPLSGSSSRPPHSPERVPSAGRGGVFREKEGEREREQR